MLEIHIIKARFWGKCLYFCKDKTTNQNLKIMKNILLVFGLLFLLFSCETETKRPFLKKIKEEIKYITFDKNEFAKADTIEILYEISGFVVFASVKTTLIKDTANNQYLTSIYYSRGKTLVNKKMPIDVVNDVFEIQEQVTQYQSEKNIYSPAEFENLSILINKKMLNSHKEGHIKDDKWSREYDNFLEKILK